MHNSQFKLTGLTCDACLRLVRKRLGKIADIQGIQVDLTGAVSIEAGRDVSRSEIETALAGTPYSLT